MPLDAARFRHTLGHLASGVTVVTVADEHGTWHGMTASAVTSLSLAPPMILACIDHEALIHDLVVGADRFGVHVLAEDQQPVAERFADRARHALTDAHQHTPSGLPLISGALAQLEVRRAAVYEGGDHSIVTGVVEWSEVREGRPLLYFRSRYRALDP